MFICLHGVPFIENQKGRESEKGLKLDKKKKAMKAEK